MTSRSRDRRRRPSVPAAIAASLVVLGAVFIVVGLVSTGGESPVSAPVAAAPAPSTVPTITAPSTTVVPERRPPPTWLAVPSIGVESEIIETGLTPTGELAVPDDYGRAAWYRLGPVPGDRGPSVIVGHVDSFSGPAVFYRLGELVPGDPIEVGLADGSEQHFVVQRVERVAKDEFPTESVYGDTNGAELRLITCGGTFDTNERSYRDNVIVYAAAAP